MYYIRFVIFIFSMNHSLMKYEDQQAFNNMHIPKEISLFPNHMLTLEKLDLKYFQKERIIIQKFLKALHNLLIA